MIPQIEKIYHYTSLNKAIELILPNKQLLLNLFLKTNDPRETKDYWLGMECKSGDYDLSSFSLEEIRNKTSTIIKNSFKVVCFSLDSSTQKGYQILSMWAHYGDNHKGVCLEIDMKKFCEENKEILQDSIFKNVDYFELNLKSLQKFPNINLSQMHKLGVEKYIRNDFSIANSDYLFFRKSREWASENEIRLVWKSDNPENEFCSIKDSLTKLYCGVDSKKEYLPTLESLCDNVEIKYLNFMHERLF